MTGSVLLFVSYIATTMGIMNPNLEVLLKFSPLSYYQGARAIGAMEWVWFAGLELPLPFLGKRRLAES
jgi:hypothetical protein